jgi:hypothetical protein
LSSLLLPFIEAGHHDVPEIQALVFSIVGIVFQSVAGIEDILLSRRRLVISDSSVSLMQREILQAAVACRDTNTFGQSAL